MVVEDNKSILKLLEQFVARSHFDVISSPDGAAAIEMLANHTPDIVLLDLAMPGVNGLDVLRHIRQEPRLKHTRVVAMTAHADLAKEASQLERVDGVLMKPFNLTRLIAIVEDLLQGKSS